MERLFAFTPDIMSTLEAIVNKLPAPTGDVQASDGLPQQLTRFRRPVLRIEHRPGHIPVQHAAVLLPADVLRALNLSGQLKVGRLKINNLQMTNVVLKAKAKNGKVAINPLAGSKV